MFDLRNRSFPRRSGSSRLSSVVIGRPRSAEHPREASLEEASWKATLMPQVR